jgi:citrate synthase
VTRPDGPSGLDDAEWLTSAMGHATPDAITVAGVDLATELMGSCSLSALSFRLVASRPPTDAEERLFDAVLVSLAEHGLTPSVLAARLTYTGAPESLQGAVAAGVLGGGSVFLGVAEDTARFLHGLLAEAGPDAGAATLRSAAAGAIAAQRRAGTRTPGLGHPVHRDIDPRVPRLYALADELDLRGPHLDLLEVVAEEQAATGRDLPINGAGAAGAALADLGFDWRIIRGFTLLARTAGLLGHLAEEMDASLGMPLWKAVDHAATVRAERHRAEPGGPAASGPPMG